VITLIGAPSTGKTTTIRRYIEEYEGEGVYVDGRECLTLRMLMERILNGVGGRQATCEWAHDFPLTLEKVLRRGRGEQKRRGLGSSILVVIDHADEIEELVPSNFWEMLCKMTEMYAMEREVVFVVVSRVTIPTFLSVSMPEVFFPVYMQEQAVAVMSHPATLTESEAAFWPAYAAVVYKLYSPYTVDVGLLQQLALEQWPSLLSCKGKDLHAKLAHFSQQSRPTLQLEEHLRFLAPAEVDDKRRVHLDLSKDARWILTAAFLAAHNWPQTDMEKFSSARVSRKRKHGFASKNRVAGTRMRQTHEQQRRLGARSFEYERFLAILYTISPFLHRQSSIQADFATLVSKQLLQPMRREDILDGLTKWRIEYEFTYADAIARSLGVNLVDYMEETS